MTTAQTAHRQILHLIRYFGTFSTKYQINTMLLALMRLSEFCYPFLDVVLFLIPCLYHWCRVIFVFASKIQVMSSSLYHYDSDRRVRCLCYPSSVPWVKVTIGENYITGWLDIFCPELCLTPQVSRCHAPRLLAVLISDWICEWQHWEHVCDIVTPSRKMNFSTSLIIPRPAIES